MSAVMASWIEVPGWSMRYCLITAGSGISPSGIFVGRIREESADITKTRHIEAYSAAGETGFGWWLVEHYFSYHIDCPDGCVSGESTRGRKDPPYFQMGYGSFDHIADLVDTLVESFLPP